MKLNERIARAIDPTAWTYADAIHNQKPHTATSATFKSRAAAQRVIDGLNLDIISSHHSLDGRRHRYDLSGHFREDM